MYPATIIEKNGGCAYNLNGIRKARFMRLDKKGVAVGKVRRCVRRCTKCQKVPRSEGPKAVIMLDLPSCTFLTDHMMYAHVCDEKDRTDDERDDITTDNDLSAHSPNAVRQLIDSDEEGNPRTGPKVRTPATPVTPKVGDTPKTPKTAKVDAMDTPKTARTAKVGAADTPKTPKTAKVGAADGAPQTELPPFIMAAPLTVKIAGTQNNTTKDNLEIQLLEEQIKQTKRAGDAYVDAMDAVKTYYQKLERNN